MSKSVFREKSLDRISSPEQMDDYIRVSNPGIWILLFAIVILTAGICIWGFFGFIDTKISSAWLVNDGETFCFLSEKDAASVKKDMSVMISETAYSITSVSSPEQIPGTTDDYFLSVSGFSAGDKVCTVHADTDLSEGVYDGQILVEHISPASLVFNY